MFMLGSVYTRADMRTK